MKPLHVPHNFNSILERDHPVEEKRSPLVIAATNHAFSTARDADHYLTISGRIQGRMHKLKHRLKALKNTGQRDSVDYARVEARLDELKSLCKDL